MSMTISGSSYGSMFGSMGVSGRQMPPPPPRGTQSTDSTSSTSSTSDSTSTGDSSSTSGSSPLDAVSQVLGMSTDQVVAALQQGQSLSDLASSAGVSNDDLISAIKSGMPSGTSSSSNADAVAQQIADQTGMPGQSGTQTGVSATDGVSGTDGVDGVDGVGGVDGVDGVGGMQGPPQGGPGGSGGVGGGSNGSLSQVNALDGSVSGAFGDSLSTSQSQAFDSLGSMLGTDSGSLVSSLRGGSSLSDLADQAGVSTDSLSGVLQDGLLVDTRS